MLVVAQAGRLGECSVFDHEPPLIERVRRTPAIRRDRLVIYTRRLRQGLPGDLERETARLVRRSRRRPFGGRARRLRR